MLETWGISSQVLNPKDPIVTIERQHLNHLIVNAGLGKLLLAGVHLAVFHLVIPAVTTSINFLKTDLESSNSEQDNYFWNNVKGVWYYL